MSSLAPKIVGGGLVAAWSLVEGGLELSRRVKQGLGVGDRRAGAVIPFGDRVLAWIPSGAGSGPWQLPTVTPGPLASSPEQALLAGLSRDFGIEGELVRRVYQHCADGVTTDWWLVAVPPASLGQVPRRPFGALRAGWVERELIRRHVDADDGQDRVMAEFQRLVMDSERPRLPERRMLVDGLEIAWTELGEGPPLLLLHGLGSDLQVFRWNAPSWAERRRVIALDLPGHGETEKPDMALSISLLRHTVGRFLDELGLDSVELLGYSMGGQVAQHFAAAHPERVRSLALLAPAGCHHEHIRPERHRRAAALLQHPLYPLVRDRLFTRRFKSFYSRHTAEVDVIYQETLELAQSRDFLPWLRGMGELIESMLRMPTKPLLGRITAPTLVLFGSEDRVVPPASGRDIERGIPNATLRLLPGCGHLLNVELRDEVNESVLPFLREHERAAVRPAEVSA